jgi:hypothetical protein
VLDTSLATATALTLAVTILFQGRGKIFKPIIRTETTEKKRKKNK